MSWGRTVSIEMLPVLLCCCCWLFVSVTTENVQEVFTTKLFIIPINPSSLKWPSTVVNDTTDGHHFSYHPSLLDSPDLPSWMYYVYSKRHSSGFIFGVPPRNQGNFKIEVIGLNQLTYETGRCVIHINVIEKPDPFLNEVEIKIDNLNIENMFDQDRLSRLLDVFRKKLWPESVDDLYITFLASAVQLGARLPLTPDEGEGVVLRLGSKAEFSSTLYGLQEEVKPLKKIMDSCRDFKRTSVERILRKDGFALDWCYFNLNKDSLAKTNRSCGTLHYSLLIDSPGLNILWNRPAKHEIPCRNYTSEFAITLIIPITFMMLLVLLLSAILCFHHEGMVDEPSNEFFDSVFNICEEFWRSKRNEDTPDVLMVQYEAVHRATHTLRSLSNQRNSNGTHKESPRLSSERTPGVRPSPPPYVGSRSLGSRVDF